MIKWLKLLLGLGAVALVWQLRGGWEAVRPALSAAGWTGLAAVTAYHLVPVAACGLAWRAVVAEAPPGATAACLLGRWLRDAVNQLLSFLPAGGEVAGGRLLVNRGVAPAAATASTMVDLTLELASQAAFGMIGVLAWAALHPESGVVRWGAMGMAASLPLVAGAVAAQRGGMLRRLEARLFPDAWRMPGLHDRLEALWRQPRRLTAGFAVHLLAWLLGAGEAWLALHLMAVPVGWVEVVALESMVYALRSAAFMVPAGLGVQEGGYVLLGAALGLPGEAALAVSLLKRGRELALGVPALLAWHRFDRS